MWHRPAVLVDAGLLVLEDLGPRRSLAEILHEGNTVLDTEGLRSFASGLGTLNALSVDRQEAYYTRRRALGPVAP